MDNDAYYPAMLRVQPGQTIRSPTQEGEDHLLTAKIGSFDTGVYDSGTPYIMARAVRGGIRTHSSSTAHV
jgi:hypothetical protein